MSGTEDYFLLETCVWRGLSWGVVCGDQKPTLLINETYSNQDWASDSEIIFQSRVIPHKKRAEFYILNSAL